MRFAPGRVNSHHPYRLFTRVITAGLFAPATMWDRPGSGGCRWVGQSRPGLRARVTAAVRFSTPSLRYRARWWVFTVFSET
jgi:hypothetical protein